MSELKEYFLTSRHGDCGNSVMFHNHDERGYGSDLNKLQTYSKEETQKKHDNFGRDSLPLLVKKVIESCTRRVDCQYPDVAIGAPRSELTLCVVSIAGSYDGNDIQFMSNDGGYTYNLEDALVSPLSKLKGLGCNRVIWSLAYLSEMSRITFQRKSVNTRSMCRGVKLQRIKKSSDSGKTRWNCPSCGKIHWQYNPYDFEGCNDYTCDESSARRY